MDEGGQITTTRNLTPCYQLVRQWKQWLFWPEGTTWVLNMPVLVFPKDPARVQFGKGICPRRTDQRKGLGLFGQVRYFLCIALAELLFISVKKKMCKIKKLTAWFTSHEKLLQSIFKIKCCSATNDTIFIFVEIAVIATELSCTSSHAGQKYYLFYRKTQTKWLA